MRKEAVSLQANVKNLVQGKNTNNMTIDKGKTWDHGMFHF